METITITLDRAEVSGYSGMTVLDLARESGVSIPTLCHEPCLAPTGACRLCLVKDERSGALLAACVTPIRSGMVINTRSSRVVERRKMIVKLMLASHPDSCLVCDKGNRCLLHQIAAEMGIGLLDIPRIPQPGTIDEVNPFIERDLSKCVLCGKCIRADQELVVVGAIDYIYRGTAARPATLNDMPLEDSECTFCGTCVTMCPTGAIMEKHRAYRGTITTPVSTVCPFCGCGCTLSLEVKDNRIVRATPDSESTPGLKTLLCARGAYGLDFVHSPDRLTRPLIKVEGQFQVASWEQALERIATGFARLKVQHGADSLAVLGSSKCSNEENYLLQRLARQVIGTNNVDNGSRLYNAPGRLGLGWSTGFPGTTNSLAGLEHSGVIMVIGADPTVSAPAVGYVIKRAVRYKGAKLILIDPRRTGLSAFARVWLRPKPGTDLALLNSLAKVILDEKLFDIEFTTRKTDNFDDLVSSLKSCDPQQVAGITCLQAEDIRAAARLFAGTEQTSIVFGNGIAQQVNATNAVLALANLAMLTGATSGRGGVFALQRENNAQGACDMGTLPDSFPGYRSVGDAQARQIFEKRWGSGLPEKAGLGALEMMTQTGDRKIRGMLVVGENPVASFPSPSLVRNSLASLDLLIVSDMFLTETAKLAHVVLPAAGFAEKEGSFTNFEGRVQRANKALVPPGDSLPDWTILVEIARSMGHPMPYSSVQQVREEIVELVPMYRQDEPDSEDEPAELESRRVGARRFHRAPFPTGFGRFAAVQYVPPDTAGDGYPLTLLTGSVLHHFGSGTRSSRASRLRRYQPDACLEISAADAAKLCLKDGEAVRIVSPDGSLINKVRISDALSTGTLFMPGCFPETPVNELFGIALDPRSGTPALKSCAVRLERIS